LFVPVKSTNAIAYRAAATLDTIGFEGRFD
jgi:hypothetical protein